MTKKQIYLTFIFGIILSIGLYDFLSNFNPVSEYPAQQNKNIHTKNDSILQKKNKNLTLKTNSVLDEQQLIDELTDESVIINYLKKHHQLPGYYITKYEAKKKGWIASKRNLCEILPGKVIGGDIFGNREGKLPKNKQYFEADVNYKCGKRNSDRVIFTKKGEVWLTKDHYRTFEKQ